MLSKEQCITLADELMREERRARTSSRLRLPGFLLPYRLPELAHLDPDHQQRLLKVAVANADRRPRLVLPFILFIASVLAFAFLATDALRNLVPFPGLFLILGLGFGGLRRSIVRDEVKALLTAQTLRS